MSIYSSDAHAIFNCISKARVNKAQDISIGDRVWLARNVMVTKGSVIENDVVVGASSVVNKRLRANSVYAGVPAKLLTSNIIWTQDRTNIFPENRVNLSQNIQIIEKQISMQPIEVISAERAFSNLNSLSFYPSPSKNADRLIPLPKIDHIPHFRINKSSKIFTIGSCFARNIERYLIGSGFHVVSNEFSQHINGDISIQNKYNSASIRQDLEIALAKPGLLENVFESFYDLDNAYFSLHFGGSGQIEKRSLSDLKLLTKKYYDTVRKIVECDLVIITLGLVEVWYDKVANCFLNIAPPKSIIARYPDRYEVRVQSYQDILSDLNKIYEIIEKHLIPNSKVLITVSPVPLHATFRTLDVLQANMYSKSVQRAAIDEFIKDKDRVNYFPSYEIVNLADHNKAWISSDYRHVNADMVAHIMSNFLGKYVDNMKVIPSKEDIIQDFKNKKYLDIYKNISQLFLQNESYWDAPRPQFLYVNYYYGLACEFLIKEKNDLYYHLAEKYLYSVFKANNKHFNSAIKLIGLYIRYNEKSKASDLIEEVLCIDASNKNALKIKESLYI